MPQIRHNNLPSHNAYHGLLAKLVLQYWSQENDGKTGCAVQDAYDIDEVEGQRVLDFNGIQFGVGAGAKVVFGWLSSRQQHECVS